MTTTPIVVRATNPRLRRGAHVADGVDHLGDRRSRRQRPRRARRHPEQDDGGERARAGGEQEDPADAEPRQADQHSGQRRGDDPHRLLGRLAEHHGVADLLWLDDLGDEGDARREVEGEGRGLHGAGEQQHPVLDDVGDDGDADQQRGGHEHRHGDQQHGPLGEAVGGDAAPRRGEEHRDAERQHHAAEPGVAAGEVLGQPAAADGLAHHPEDHGRCAVEQPAVPGRLHHRRHGRPQYGSTHRRRAADGGTR